MHKPLRFADVVTRRPVPTGLDACCKLQHFAIITYAVDLQRAQDFIPSQYQLDTITIDGQQKALLSVVPFMAVNFTSAVFPFPKFNMGHTDYRMYVTDKLTGERCVWVLGTTLDSWARIIPRYLWQLRWHSGRVAITCDYNAQQQHYNDYRLSVQGRWAPAKARLMQQTAPLQLPGFADNETGLVYLTHAMTGVYLRRDGKLGSYAVWHKPLEVKPGKLLHAEFGLLDKLGLVSPAAQQLPHSVLLQHSTDFTIYLPPTLLD